MAARPYHFHVFDVFTTERYAGNPLAIVLGADDLDGGAMQRIASEFNLSETIFVMAPERGDNEARVRIFTPRYEMAFAGHPTIGCAIHLAERHWPKGRIDETLVLEEDAGPVPVKVTRRDGEMRATFTAPVVPTPIEAAVDREALASALHLDPGDLRDDHPLGVHEGGPAFLYVPLRDLDALARARPLGPGWRDALPEAVHSVYCYAPETEKGADWRARMFAPDAGIMEDAATGSASAILASQLLVVGVLGEGTTGLRLRQGVEMGRPSEIGVEIDVASGALAAVRVSGSAVRVSDGQILA